LSLTGPVLVLAVADIQATCNFYSRVSGMEIVRFEGRSGTTHRGHQGNSVILPARPDINLIELSGISESDPE
jgi:catechol 2,3-dioxygenase-like lactoylglutathione lyase family enzyme